METRDSEYGSDIVSDDTHSMFEIGERPDASVLPICWLNVFASAKPISFTKELDSWNCGGVIMPKSL